MPHGRCVYCFVAAVLHVGILIYLFFRHEKFFYSFVPSWPMLFIAFLLLLYTIKFAWYNSFSFSLFFCRHLISYLFVFVPYDWCLSYYLFLLFLVIISFPLVCFFVCSVLFCSGVRSSLILLVTLCMVTTPYGVRILLGLLSGMTSFINLFVNSWRMLFIDLLWNCSQSVF